MGEIKQEDRIFEDILQGITDSVLLLSKEYKILWANKAFQNQTGYKIEEIIGKHCYKVTHHQEAPCQPPHGVCPVIEAEKINSAATTTHIHFDAGGNKIFVQASAYPVKDEKGEITRFVCMYKDITDLKRMEEKLCETLSDSERLANNLAERVKELNCLYSISRLTDKSELTVEELIQGIVNIIPPAWQYPVVTCARITMEAHEFKTENFKETVWKQAADLLVYGNRIGTVEVCYLEEKQDYDEGPFLKEERSLLNAIAERLGRIIERKKAEVLLQESENKYHLLFSNMTNAFAYHEVLFDYSGKPCDYIFLEINDTFEKLTGLKRENIIGKKVTEVLPGIEIDPADWIGTYGRVAMTGKAISLENYSEALNRWYSISAFSPAKGYFAVTFEDITERKMAEEAGRKMTEKTIREQSDILDSLFKDTITPLVLLDRDFNFIRLNEAYARSCNRDVTEFKGHNHFEFYPHEENEAIFRKVVEAKFPYQAIAKPFVFPDHPEWGVTYWDWTLTPLLDTNGEVNFLVFALNDVTNRIKAENRIKATNNLLSLFVTKSTRKEYLDSVIDLLHEWTECNCIGIRTLDKRGNIPYESYRGFSQDFWQQENWISVKNQCTCTRVVLQKPDPQDMKMMTPNGSFRCNNTEEFAGQLTEKELSRYRGLCIRTGFKSIAIIPIQYKETVLGAFHIADRREGMVPLEKIEFIESISPLVGEAILRFSAEEELLRSEARLSEAQSIAHLGNWDWNIQTNQLYWSDEIYRIFGLAPQQFGATYEAFLDSVHPDDRESVKKAVKESLYKKKPYSIDHRIVLPDGAMRIVHEQGEVTIDDTGNPIRMIGTVQDITDINRAEEALKKSYEQLRNLSAHLQSVREEERAKVAREIHDELGQALTALKIDLSMLTTKLYPDHKPLVEKAGSMTERIDETIQTVKKICTELRPTILDHFGLTAAMEWQAKDFERRSGIICNVSLGPKEIILDQDTSTAVFRILQEALTNVARHANATEVEVGLKEWNGLLVLKVKDNGKGITEKQISKSNSFGLLGVKERVHFRGGKVDIKGVQNKGTTVTVSIPIKKEEKG